MQTTVVHIHQYYIENYFWLLVSLRSQLCAKQYGGGHEAQAIKAT